MINLTRASNKDKHSTTVIGRFKHDARCKKHPKHHQSPGVCSLCLREKLTHITTCSSRAPPPPSSTAASSSISSLSSYYSSSSASSCASPAPHRLRFPTDGKSTSSISIFFFNAKHGLSKSRSMALVPRRRDADGHHDHRNKSTKKGGLFFKLLRPRSKTMEHKDTKLVHSRSSRENVAIATS